MNVEPRSIGRLVENVRSRLLPNPGADTLPTTSDFAEGQRRTHVDVTPPCDHVLTLSQTAWRDSHAPLDMALTIGPQ